MIGSFLVMHLKVTTSVKADLSQVKAGFDEKLFVSLNPPFPTVALLQFDGCERGDRVAIELDFLLFKQKWISDITESSETSEQWRFIDEGVELPFFLKNWKHRHVVLARSNGSLIIDDIDFSSGYWLLDLLLFPVLKLQFLYRKPIYKRFFNHKA